MQQRLIVAQESRILEIDDAPVAIRLQATILRDYGKIYFATNSSDALIKAQSINPDLILLDIDHAESGRSSKVTASIGVGCNHLLCGNNRKCRKETGGSGSGINCGLTPANLIRLADLALYQAKQNGPNSIEVANKVPYVL